jgi:hypothetical protein
VRRADELPRRADVRHCGITRASSVTRRPKGNNDFQFGLAGRSESTSIAEFGAYCTWNDRDKV